MERTNGIKFEDRMVSQGSFLPMKLLSSGENLNILLNKI